MGDKNPALYTLTSIDRGASLRLPDIRVIATLPDRRVITTSFGIYPLLVGTSADCDILLSDPRVSRRHCELRLTEKGVLIRDLASKNGTLIGGAPVVEAFLPPGVPAIVGDTEILVHATGSSAVLPLSPRAAFGECVGQSLPMRALFATLERAAPTDETILLLGESGTGKEILARGIHAHSKWKDGPFVVVDCGAIAPNLIEGELFGYVRGAFTGAAAARTGLLEEANGGTLFIDELGELPLDLQPKLLRAIESRQIRKLGSNEWTPWSARIVAATHRNLRQKASEGTFREDLYYRIAVVEVHVPALREHKDDIDLLVERFLATRDPPSSIADLPPRTIALLKAYDWPGNVRELRNTVARLVLFPELLPQLIGPSKGAGERETTGSPTAPPPPDKSAAPVDTAGAAEAGADEAQEGDVERLGMLLELPLPDARQVVMERFERRYLAVKLRQHGGNISRVADAIGVSRQLIYRLMERYALRGK
jgi:transcriptional regulator with PAS, ATPase and Fis domain